MKKRFLLLITLCTLIGVLGGCSEKETGSEALSSTAVAQEESSPQDTDEAQDDTNLVTEVDGIDLSQFSLIDTNGNTITQDIFQDYDITMVNCWATWCPYCIEEMPYLNEFYSQLPENINLIGICMDSHTEPEDFKELVEELNLDFPILESTQDFCDAMGEANILGYPTTYFVAKDGTIIGQQIGTPSVGTDMSTVKNGYQTLLDQIAEILHEK